MKSNSRALNFEDVFSDQTKNYMKLDSQKYLDIGNIPIIDQGNNIIAGYANIEIDKTYDFDPVIVFGDHTRRFKYIDFPFCLGADGAKVLKPKNKADTKYLFHYLCSLDIENNGYSRHFKFLKRKEFILPPLAEQKRIAEILDKANEIKAKRELALAKLDELAMSMFEELCEKDKMKKNIKIENLVIKNKLIDTDKEEVWNLTLDQIDSNGGEINGFLQVNRSEVGSSTYYFKPPVVLYSKLRPYLNKVVMPEIDGYATTELVPLYCNEELISPVFLLNYLRSKKFVEFANINSGGAKMPRVMMDKFWKHEIKLPSKVTQHKFDLIYDQIKAQKSILKNNLTTHNLLFNSLQHEAFTTGFNA